MELNTATLLTERGRLVAVVEEAKTARTKIASIDRLLVLYGAEKRSAPNGDGGKKQRKQYPDSFKKKIAREAIRNEIGPTARKHGIHTSVIRNWVNQGWAE